MPSNNMPRSPGSRASFTASADVHCNTTSCRVSILVRRLAVGTVLLPLAALTLCTVLTLCLHHEVATRTHCDVANLYPSVSSSIGKFAPQKFVWRALIALHLAPRLLLGALYTRHVMARVGRSAAAVMCGFLYCLEMLGLVTVSFVGSNEHYALHRVGFSVFLVAAELHMLLLTALLARSRRGHWTSHHEWMAHRWRCRIIVPNLVCLMNAIYAFVRHNWLCEPGVYSVFGIYETCIILSNMAFHVTAYYDFHDYKLIVVAG